MTQPPPQGEPGYTPPAQPGYTPPPQGGYVPPPQGGYVPPPQGGYVPPPGGYPPPVPAAPPGYANAEEKTWALVSTFGAAAGTLISFGALACLGPFIAYLAKGKESATVKAHSAAALNFFIPVSGISLVLFFLRFCAGAVLNFGILWSLVSGLLWLVQFAVWVIAIVFGVISGLKANEGQVYKYPFSLSLIK